MFTTLAIVLVRWFNGVRRRLLTIILFLAVEAAAIVIWSRLTNTDASVLGLFTVRQMMGWIVGLVVGIFLIAYLMAWGDDLKASGRRR